MRLDRILSRNFWIYYLKHKERLQETKASRHTAMRARHSTLKLKWDSRSMRNYSAYIIDDNTDRTLSTKCAQALVLLSFLLVPYCINRSEDFDVYRNLHGSFRCHSSALCVNRKLFIRERGDIDRTTTLLVIDRAISEAYPALVMKKFPFEQLDILLLVRRNTRMVPDESQGLALPFFLLAV